MSGLVVLLLTLTGCGTLATQPTAVSPDSTPETHSADTVLVDKSGTAPGLSFSHPAGWELLEADPQSLMLYSAEDAGLRLFNIGLQPSEVVVQVSATPRNRVENDLMNYAVSLASSTTATFGEPQPVTLNGFEGYQLTGGTDLFYVVVTVTQQFDQFVEVIAYTRPDEADQHRPQIDSILNSAIWKLPTE